jgi:hypothetical protein
VLGYIANIETTLFSPALTRTFFSGHPSSLST